MTPLPLPVSEWRALFSDGPAIALVAKADAVALLDRVQELEAALGQARTAEQAWVRSSMAQERRAIRAEAEIQALRAAIRAVLDGDGMQGRGS